MLFAFSILEYNVFYFLLPLLSSFSDHVINKLTVIWKNCFLTDIHFMWVISFTLLLAMNLSAGLNRHTPSSDCFGGWAHLWPVISYILLTASRFTDFLVSVGFRRFVLTRCPFSCIRQPFRFPLIHLLLMFKFEHFPL